MDNTPKTISNISLVGLLLLTGLGFLLSTYFVNIIDALILKSAIAYGGQILLTVLTGGGALAIFLLFLGLGLYLLYWNETRIEAKIAINNAMSNTVPTIVHSEPASAILELDALIDMTIVDEKPKDLVGHTNLGTLKLINATELLSKVGHKIVLYGVIDGTSFVLENWYDPANDA